MGTRIARVLFCAVGAAALCSSSFGQIVKTKAGYLLRAHYVKGKVIKYDSATTVKGGGADIPSFHTPITVEVTKVVRGIGTVKITKGALMVKGQVLMPASTIELSLDNRNSADKKGTPEIGPPLPIKPIVPGSAWSSVMPITLLGQVHQLTSDYRFAGMKVVKGQSLGVITFTLSGMIDGTGVMYIRASDGTMESSEMKLSLGKGVTGDSSQQMARVTILLTRN